MKVFISWSGRASHECAKLLKAWLKKNIQACDPWLSSEDIDKGANWGKELNTQLSETKLGILCLTKHNKNKPWLLYEAGALAKGLSSTKICTFLINLTEQQIDLPLSQFQATKPTKGDMRKLLISINRELGESALESGFLSETFDHFWSDFKQKYDGIDKTAENNSEPVVERSQEAMIEEVLLTTRGLSQQLSELENSISIERFHLGKVRQEAKSDSGTVIANQKMIEAAFRRKLRALAANSRKIQPFQNDTVDIEKPDEDKECS